MPSMDQSHVLKVTTLGKGLPGSGAPAADWGRVVGVFPRSCHVLNAEGRVTCIVDRQLGKGPVNVCVDVPKGFALADLGVETGTHVRRIREDVYLGDRIVLDLSGAELWTPPLMGPQAGAAEVRPRTRTLCAALGQDAPDEGLAPLVPIAEHLAWGWTVEPEPTTPVTTVALPNALGLVRGLVSIDTPLVDASVAGLIGLGPGLTPSGDDFLAGLMVALVCVGPDAAVSALRGSIATLAPDRTTALSATLLAHAGQGASSETAHRLLKTLFEAGDQPDAEKVARELADVGHTSGWDLLAGLLVGIHLALRLRVAGEGLLPARGWTGAGAGR